MRWDRRGWLALAAASGTAALAAGMNAAFGTGRSAGRQTATATGPDGLPPRAGTPAAPPAEICIVAPPEAWDPASGRPRNAPRTPGDTSRCPVCGMFVARHPRWVSQVLHRDGHVQFFDSPLHLLLFLQEPGRWRPGWARADLINPHVADHGDGHWIPLDQARMVLGARETGPMRQPDLAAFARPEDALAHALQWGGTVQAASELVRRLPDALQALASHRH